MIRTFAILLVPAALALAGCISSGETIQVEHFTLGGAAPPAQNASATNQRGTHILRIAEIDAPNWLDSTNLYYRLEYRNGAKISAYSRSDWVAPPPALLANVLQATLAAGAGQWKAILGPNDVARADLTLQVKLNDFEQQFMSAQQSIGLLDATATLFDANGIVAQRQFHIEKPAPSADAAGGVKALSEASQAFAGNIRQWLADFAPSAHNG